MVDDYMPDKVLNKIRMIIGIEKFDGTKKLIESARFKNYIDSNRNFKCLKNKIEKNVEKYLYSLIVFIISSLKISKQ